MFDFIVENLSTIIVVLILALIVAIIIAFIIRSKKRGDGCSMDCFGCRYSDNCKHKK